MKNFLLFLSSQKKLSSLILVSLGSKGKGFRFEKGKTIKENNTEEKSQKDKRENKVLQYLLFGKGYKM